MSVTPESTKTVSLTGGKSSGDGPTPKNEFKKPMLKQKQFFMSPTDAMVSPCTQKLQSSRLLPRRPLNHRPKVVLRSSKLADKENEMRAEIVKASIEEEPETVSQPTASSTDI